MERNLSKVDEWKTEEERENFRHYLLNLPGYRTNMPLHEIYDAQMAAANMEEQRRRCGGGLNMFSCNGVANTFLGW
jgi:hypothetical protein